MTQTYFMSILPYYVKLFKCYDGKNYGNFVAIAGPAALCDNPPEHTALGISRSPFRKERFSQSAPHML